jgi:hypothetical protein
MKNTRYLTATLSFLLISCSQSVGFVVTIPITEEEETGPVTGRGGSGSFTNLPPTKPALALETTAYHSVTLSWTHAHFGAGYKLFRKAGPCNGDSFGEAIKTLSSDTRYYEDIGVPQGTTYCYAISAFNMAGEVSSDAVAATTLTCNDTTPPRLAAGYPKVDTAQQYPSVKSDAIGFDRSRYVKVSFLVEDADGCGLYRAELKTARSDATIAGNRMAENLRPGDLKTWSVRIPNSSESPEGTYTNEISILANGAVQGTGSVSFSVLSLPSDTTPPWLDSASTSYTVCAGSQHNLRFTFKDDSSPSPLGEDWLKTTLYENGTPVAGYTGVYTRTIARQFIAPIPSGGTITKVFTAEAMDFAGNLFTAPPITWQVTTDTTPPTISSPSFPSGTDLTTHQSYTISATVTDNCYQSKLQHKFEFVESASGGQTYVLSGWGNFSSLSSWVPNGTPPAGSVGRLRITARDGAGNQASSTSPTEYTIKPSNRPAISLDIDDPSSIRAGDTVAIDIVASGVDLTNARIENLLYTFEALDPSPIAATDHFSSSSESHSIVQNWTVPLFPGTYTITADVVATIGSTDYRASATPLQIRVLGEDTSYKVLYLDLDLNDDLSFTKVVSYDIDDDGETETMRWLNEGDGYLVIDAGGDGIITNIREFPSVEDLSLYGTVIDTNHPLYTTLLVWRDANSNAVTDAGELLSLQDLGILDVTLGDEIEFRITR